MSEEISEVTLEQIARDKRVSAGELAALKLALKKRKSKDIAESLDISEAAARKRLGEVYRKFDIKGRGPGKLASLEQKLIDQANDPGSRYSLVGRTATPMFDGASVAASVAMPSAVGGARTLCHWGNAPRNVWFQGRHESVRSLSQWILEPASSTKLLAICGIGGIGKTCLSVKLAESVGPHFQQVVWLSLDPEQPPEAFFRSLLMTLQANASSKIRLRSSGRRLERTPVTITDESGDRRGDLVGEPLATESASHLETSHLSASHLSVSHLVQQLMLHFSRQRCLVILDGFEAVFKSEQASGEGAPTFNVSRRQQASAYKEGFEAYGKLLDAIKDSARRFQTLQIDGNASDDEVLSPSSCLILTSREKPRELLSVAAQDAIRLHALSGLSDADAKAVIEKFCLQGTLADYQNFARRYSGHPMALLLAANTIQDFFSGSIRAFLDQDVSVFDDLRSVLKDQFKRLAAAEKEAIYWLAINQTPCSLESLKADIVSRDHKANLLYTLRSLERRSLVEVIQPVGTGISVQYRLHPIVSDYALDRFVREIFCELVRGDLAVFNSFALLKADAEDNLRELQIKRIVQPILERLNNHFRNLGKVEDHLSDRLDAFRNEYRSRLGYAGGNFLNLLVHLSGGDLSNKDFSELVIWQAYLPGVRLSKSNFNSCQLERSVFTESLGDVLAIDFRTLKGRIEKENSPLLAAGDANGFVHLWMSERAAKADRYSASNTKLGGKSGSGTSGQVLSHKLAQWTAHSGWVRSLSFVPRSSYLVTGGDDNKVKLWQLPLHQRGGAARLVWARDTYDWIHAIAVSPDGKTIACGDGDKITLRRTRDGDPIHHIPDVSVRTLAFSPDGAWLASCGEDGAIRLWSTADIEAARANMQPVTVLKGHCGLVHTVRFSPDSRRLLSGGNDRRVVVWEITSAGDPIGKKKHEFGRLGDRVRTLAISPDGRYLASGGDDARLRLWNLETFELVQVISTERSRLWSTAFYQQGSKLLLAVGGDKQRLTLWQIEQDMREPDVESEPEIKPLRGYRGYTRGIRSLAYLGDHRIIGGGDSGDLLVWDAKTGEKTTMLSLHSGRIWAVAIDDQKKRIASASDDYTVRLWNAHTGQCLTTLVGHSSWVRTVSFSDHGRYLASAGDDCTIRIWNTVSGICSTVLESSENWIRSVAFNPVNSRYLVSGGDAQVVRLWNRKEDRFEALAHHDHRICSVAFSRDGEWVASGSDDATVIVWNVRKKEIAYRFRQPTLGIKSVSFSPCGKYLAAGGEDQIVFVWNLESSDPDKHCLKLRPYDYTGLAGGVRSVVFSPDSKWIISGGLDEMVRWGGLSKMETLGDDDEDALVPLIERDRPYEKLEIENVTGLSSLQVANLLSLGAVNSKKSLFPQIN